MQERPILDLESLSDGHQSGPGQCQDLHVDGEEEGSLMSQRHSDVSVQCCPEDCFATEASADLDPALVAADPDSAAAFGEAFAVSRDDVEVVVESGPILHPEDLELLELEEVLEALSQALAEQARALEAASASAYEARMATSSWPVSSPEARTPFNGLCHFAGGDAGDCGVADGAAMGDCSLGDVASSDARVDEDTLDSANPDGGAICVGGFADSVAGIECSSCDVSDRIVGVAEATCNDADAASGAAGVVGVGGVINSAKDLNGNGGDIVNCVRVFEPARDNADAASVAFGMVSVADSAAGLDSSPGDIANNAVGIAGFACDGADAASGSAGIVNDRAIDCSRAGTAYSAAADMAVVPSGGLALKVELRRPWQEGAADDAAGPASARRILARSPLKGATTTSGRRSLGNLRSRRYSTSPTNAKTAAPRRV